MIHDHTTARVMTRIAVVLRKERHELSFSETFVRAHLERLPCTTSLLIGIPGHWKSIPDDRFIPTRSLLPLGCRWLMRRLNVASVTAQDRRAMGAHLRRAGVSAVLAEYGPSAVAVMDACRDANVPLIAHFHGYDAYTRYVLDTFGKRYRELFDNAAAVVTVSTHMRHRLIELGADPARTHYNSCGADLPQGLSAQPHEQPPRFVMVGRLTEKKAPVSALLAFSTLGIDDATLDVVGDGPLMEACRGLVSSQALDDRVTFHGALPHERVLDILLQARCFIQHSVVAPDGDREGTPVSVLEAMGLGLPVVATRHGGIPDVIDRPELGTLVAEHDVDAMSAAMRHFALSPELARLTGQCARREVMQKWTADQRIMRLWQIIDDAIGGTGTRSGPSGAAATVNTGSTAPT
jgi:colanic acid/amylovoran biosynthesis glycosyltransferase